MLKISELWIYPVKSLAGIALREAIPQRRGFQYDRRWMLIDENGRFVSQRQLPAMALIGAALEPPFLTLFDRKNPDDRVQTPLEPAADEHAMLEVSIWNDLCLAQAAWPEADQWCSRLLGTALRLAYMPDSARRPADARYAPEGQHVSFADGYPYLLVGQASLDALNARLAEPLPMNRFRPNIVFTGGAAHEEDEWADIKIGAQLFKGVKPCARCIVTTIDQDTALKAAEPLRALSAYRQKDHKILFGQNAVWLEAETVQQPIRVGDTIFIPS